MTGLDNLLKEIQTLAREEADQILRSAECESEKIAEENRERIDSRTKEILTRAEAEAKNITERGASSQRIQQRNEMLALKQDLIRETAEKARQSLVDLPDTEYFGLLKNWAVQAELTEQAVIRLNERDLARKKDGFLESFPHGAKLSEQPAEIPGGFLAVCGGVTINCSIDAVFEIHADAIHHDLRRILFHQEHGDEE